VASLTRGLDDADSEARISAIWALGSSGDPTVVPRLAPLVTSDDAGIRKMAVYALGALPGDEQVIPLRTALQDTQPDVRWNAAVALARHNSPAGEGVLREMLDRTLVEGTVVRGVSQFADQNPVDEVIISGIRAAAALKSEGLRPAVEKLSQQDPSMKVRTAALEALSDMNQ
jgi:HEAT repeat protein